MKEETAPTTQALETYAQGAQSVRRGDLLTVSGKTYWVNTINALPLRGAVTNQIVLEDMLLPVLTDSIAIERVSRVSNGAGGYTETWATSSTVDGRITHSGNNLDERLVAERVASRTGYTVILAAGAEVTPADRLRVGTRLLLISSIIRTSFESALICLCSEVI